MDPAEARSRYIQASEVGQYAYCARAWWLGSVLGLSSSRQNDLAAGVAAHRAHGRRVRRVSSLTRAAWACLGLALLLAGAGLWLFLST